MTSQTETPDQPETPVEPGSLPLANARWEKFAHRLSWGASQAKSYLIAGFPESAGYQTSASRLARKPEVAQRVAWLKAQVAKAHIYDGQRIVERLAYMADALSEIRIDPDTGDRRPGPMFNAQAAARTLELLGRAEGIFKDKIELGGQVSVGNVEMIRKMKPEERGLLKELLMSVQARPPAPANDDTEAPAVPEEQGGVVPRKA